MKWFIDLWRERPKRPAMVWRDASFSYGRLVDLYDERLGSLRSAGIGPGSCVGLVGDFSPNAIAALFAVCGAGGVVVPLAAGVTRSEARLLETSGATHVLRVDPDDSVDLQSTVQPSSRHPLLEWLAARAEPGLVLFSSGTSGEPKAALHSMSRFLSRHRRRRSSYRTLAFLLFDHVGGLNTLVYTLANRGCLIVPRSRGTTDVRKAVCAHRVELLPTSPSFLSLLLMAERERLWDFDSLKVITYGAEMMGESTLRAAVRAFPRARFQQTYGLTELGVLGSKSEDSASLLVKLGGPEFETKVEDGCLCVRGATSMLGYLNAPDPFDEEGWFNTGDKVARDGDWYRILGRSSDLINVGGLKVDPVLVEETIAQLDGVAAAAVSSELHPLLGAIVAARVQLHGHVSSLGVKRLIKRHCREKLAPFMVPSKLSIVDEIPLRRGCKKTR